MHKKNLSDPNDWDTVRFIQNEGDRYLNEMEKDLAEVDEAL